MKSLFRAGITINTRQPNVLLVYLLSHRDKGDEKVIGLLSAAGESVGGIKMELDLKGQCRKAIQKHLLKLDPLTPLFERVLKLELTKLIQRYLVYNVNIYDDCETE